MSALQRRRRIAPVIWTLVVLLLVPPGGFPEARATPWNAPMLRDTKMETFRNPMLPSAGHNRFLTTLRPGELLGGGGESLMHPGSRGYDTLAEVAQPDALWVTYKGRLVWTETDLVIPGLKFDLRFDRVYRGAVYSYAGPLGERWDFSWNKRIYAWNDDYLLYDMGRVDFYEWDSVNSTFTSPPGRYDTLTESGGKITRKDKYGVSEIYDGGGSRIKEIEDLDPDVKMIFAGNQSGELTRVHGDTTLYVDVRCAGGRITAIEDPFDGEDPRIWDYGNDSLLLSVRTPTFEHHSDNGLDFTSGKTIQYFYDAQARLTQVWLPEDVGHKTFKWEYDSTAHSGRITKQYINDEPLTLTYDEANRKVTVDDREGHRTVYFYDASDLITKRSVYSDVSTSHDTTWTYNADAEVTEVIFPLGNRISYSYDAKGNITEVAFKKDGSDSTPVEWAYEYGDHSRLTRLTDPNGHEWYYEYDHYGRLTQKAWPDVTLPSGIDTTNNNAHLNGTYDGTMTESWAYDNYGNLTLHVDTVGTTYFTAYEQVGQGVPAWASMHISDYGVGGGYTNVTKQWAYDANGNPIAYTDPELNETEYEYDSLDQLIVETRPGGVATKYYRDLNNRIVQIKVDNDTQLGNATFVTDLAYDPIGNVVQRIVDLDASTRLTTAFEYDKNDRLTKLIEPGSVITEAAWDGRGLMVAMTKKAASSSDDAITTFTYDGNNRLVTRTDPRGFDTLVVYDGYDRVTTVTRPEGNSLRMSYDPAGNLVTMKGHDDSDELLSETRFAYDEANRHYFTELWAKQANLTTSLGDGWQSEVFWRDEAGRVVAVTGDGPGARKNTYLYDALGRLVTTKDNLPSSPSYQNQRIYAYDLAGRMTSAIRNDKSQDTGIEADKSVQVTFVYDARDNLITRSEWLGSSDWGHTIYSYGSRDQLTRVKDPASRETAYEHNELLWQTEERIEIPGGTDVVVQYLHDPVNRRMTYKALNATTGDQLTVYERDPLGRLVLVTWPDSGEDEMTYDKAGNRVSRSDPMGTVRVAAYDRNNRLTRQDLTLATHVTGATRLDFGYDGLDRMTLADSFEGDGFSAKLRWTYNTLNRVETEQSILDGYASGAGRTLVNVWDEDGQRTAVTYHDGATDLAYGRDALDRVASITRDGTPIASYTFSGPRVLRKALADSQATSTYDAFGRVTQILHEEISPSQTLARFDYFYDKSHQVTAQDKLYYDDVQSTRITTDASDLGEQYVYDKAKRLVTCLRGVPSNKITTDVATNIANTDYVDKVEYVYDATGNRTTRKLNGSVDVAYEYDEANQMTKEGGATRAYTENGNFSGASNSIKYDHANRVGAATNTYKYHYDALGRVVQRDHGSTFSVRFYYDGDHIVQQFRLQGGSESLRKTFVYGERIDELLEYSDHVPNPVARYSVHADRLGSVALLVDDTGAIRESYRYEEFGTTTIVNGSFAKVTNTTTSPLGNPYRYTGRRNDIQLGSYGDDWYDYRARVMRTDVGRFMQRDPLAYVDGASLYLYVGNNPINLIDPTGMVPFPALVLALPAAKGAAVAAGAAVAEAVAGAIIAVEGVKAAVSLAGTIAGALGGTDDDEPTSPIPPPPDAAGRIGAEFEALRKGKGRGVREVNTEDEIRELGERWIEGAEKEPKVPAKPGHKEYDGEWYRHPDGTRVGLRNTCSEESGGGPTIDLQHPKAPKPEQKVHIGQ